MVQVGEEFQEQRYTDNKMRFTITTKNFELRKTDFVCESKANEKSLSSETLNSATNKNTIAIGEK
jgi:hypothetical protein